MSRTSKAEGTSTARLPRLWSLKTIYKALLAAPIMAAILTTGCQLRQWVDNGFKVGPNYAKPPAPVAPSWIDYKNSYEVVRTEKSQDIAKYKTSLTQEVVSVVPEKPDLSHWWRSLNDPALDNLIEVAYGQNLTIREAGARILEARARRNIAAGNLFPQLQEAFGSYTRNKVSGKTPFVSPELWFQNWEAGFNVGWELDFWGLYRRSIEAADAELDASVENYDDVLVVLLADVAATYVDYRTFEARIIFARKNAEVQKQLFLVSKDRFEAGVTSRRDVEQARSVYEQTLSLIPELEIGQRQANNRLCVLLGIPPTRLDQILIPSAPVAPPAEGDTTKPAIDRTLEDLLSSLPRTKIPTTPETVAIGIPADLLRRRPDVRRGERQAAAQSARIGIAKAEFYPHISIIGSLGLQAEQFGDLFDTPESTTGTIGPSFRWNILNYGRILNNVRLQDARFQQLVYAYQNQVLRAGEEAETAITSFLKSHERYDHQTEAVDSASKALQIAYDQYKEGQISFLDVYVFEVALASQLDRLAVTQGNMALSLIDLYRALGGGWEMRLTRPMQCDPAAPGGIPHGAVIDGGQTPQPGMEVLPYFPRQALPGEVSATSTPAHPQSLPPLLAPPQPAVGAQE